MSYDSVGAIIAFEQGDLSEEKIIELFQPPRRHWACRATTSLPVFGGRSTGSLSRGVRPR